MIIIKIAIRIRSIDDTIIQTMYPAICISVKGSFFSFEDLSSMSLTQPSVSFTLLFALINSSFSILFSNLDKICSQVFNSSTRLGLSSLDSFCFSWFIFSVSLSNSAIR